jgi:choline-glycine betaine transporter
MNRKLTAALLVTAAVLTNVAFTALGSIFDYPDILKEPTDDILSAFRGSESAIVGWFTVAAWTLLVIVAIGRTIAGRWFTILGAASAVLILAGVLSPLDLPGVDMANFVGYVLWSVWLVAFAALLVRTPKTAPVLTGARA